MALPALRAPLLLALLLVPVASLRAQESAAEERGNARVLASQEFLDSVDSLRIEQTQVQGVRMAGIAGVRTTTNTSTMLVSMADPMAVRMETPLQGAGTLVVIRQGERVALKLGDGDWQAPSGPFAAIGDQLADPFACPLPEPGADSPRWQVVGRERFQGVECEVVETIGDSTLPYARERMEEGMGSMPGERQLDLHSYVSRMWIGVEDGRKLKVEQRSEFDLTLIANGQERSFSVQGLSTSVYSYDDAELEIPEDAQRVLSGEPSAGD